MDESLGRLQGFPTEQSEEAEIKQVFLILSSINFFSVSSEYKTELLHLDLDMKG